MTNLLAPTTKEFLAIPRSASRVYYYSVKTHCVSVAVSLTPFNFKLCVDLTMPSNTLVVNGVCKRREMTMTLATRRSTNRNL